MIVPCLYPTPFQIMTATHKDVTERLALIDPVLMKRVQKVLGVNLSERHLRGGDATKRKYQSRKG